MAANLFRIEMTDATLNRLKDEGRIGQKIAENVHQHVGRQVRKMVKEATGQKTEDIPVERRLPDIHKQLKLGRKEMEKVDASKKATKKHKKEALKSP